MRSFNKFRVGAFVLLALASSFATAYDPSLLQDFCIAAANDADSAVFVNGKICMDPKLATADDFSHSGFNIAGNSSNQLGVNVTLLTVNAFPALNTLGLSIGRIDFAPNGLNPPHHHPRGSEVLLVLEGTLYAGVVTSNPDHRLFAKVLNAGDLFVFPMGLVHFQLNLGNTSAVAIAAFNSQNPGVMTEANALFGSNPAIDPNVLTTAFHLDKNLVESLQKQTWQNPA